MSTIKYDNSSPQQNHNICDGKTAQEHAAANQLGRLQGELEQRVEMIHSAWVDKAVRCVEAEEE